MSKVIPIEQGMGLAERFFSLARGMDVSPTDRSPVGAVRHVLAVLDALERGESGSEVSVNTLSFLALLRESEQRGDLCYASPEQIRGESLDERSLVFSVGVLLFERLTGRHPYGRDHERRVARIQRGELGSGVNYFPNVPAGLRALLMRAMGPFPEERFKSLTELRARLEQFVLDHAHVGNGPRLPGTYGKSGAKKREEATRVVRMATSFGRDLMAAHQEATGRPEARRLERLSELHLRTVRVGTDLDDSTAQPAPPVGQAREPERDQPIPAMTVLPRAPVTVVSRAAMAEPTFARSGFEPLQPEPVTVTLDTAALESAQAEARTEVSAPPSDYLELRPKRARSSGLAGRLIWAGAGALAAVAIMWFATRPSAGLEIGADPAPPAPVVQPATAPAVQSATAPAAERATPAAAPAPEVAEPAPAAPVVAEFSAERTGEQAIQAIGPCFPEARRARGVRFRVGVRFGGAKGNVDRVYFSTDAEIDATDRGCVRDRLLGLEPDAAPDTAGVVDYQIRLARNTAEVTVK